MTKASTVNAARVLGSAGGTAYDNAAKSLAYLVDEADVPFDANNDIEPGEPRRSACASGFLVRRLFTFEQLLMLPTLGGLACPSRPPASKL